MPEALAVLVVAFISAIIFVVCWFQSRDPAFHNADREAGRIQQRCHWLKERLTKARREQWSEDMIEDLALQLRAEERLVEKKAMLSS